MSVLACDRPGCDRIMCDTLIDGSWYVCPDCQEEFRLYVGRQLLTECELLAEFKDFMDTEKPEDRETSDPIAGAMSVRDWFEMNTRQR